MEGKISLGSAKRQRTKGQRRPRLHGFRECHARVCWNTEKFHELHSKFPATSIRINQSRCVCGPLPRSPVMKRNQSVHYANRFNSTLFHPDQLIFALPIKPALFFSQRRRLFVRKGDVLITKTSFILAGHKLGAHTSMLMLHMFPASTNCLKCRARHPRGWVMTRIPFTSASSGSPLESRRWGL